MAENIIMPQLGESIAEGTIVKWLKEPGDSVKKDENILLISTDKVEAEIPSPTAGVLISIGVKSGETVAVGTVLGQVGSADEKPLTLSKPEPKIAAQKPILVKEQPKIPAVPKPKFEQTQNSSMSGFFSPLVRSIATQHNLSEQELNNIPGTGRQGRVSKKDILSYLETRSDSPQEQNIPVPQQALKLEIASGDREVVKPISTMRSVIMKNMIASKKISAHVTTFFEIDYTNIDKIRAQHKARFKQEENLSLTYTTFLAAAVCQVLKRHPYINSTLQEDKIIFKKDIHLGIAVALDNPEPGLMVPVIKHADKQNLRGIAHAISDLSTRVRERKIKPDEISGGTFTITNPGNYGAIIGTPIINQPQLAILGVGKISKQAKVIEIDNSDMIAIRKMGVLSLSFDHRLIDGATADIFMADLKKTLDNWSEIP